ncbi:MAG: helix-turn-helix transcriptional regulator [Clostridia bacterium]|nr:helix-turn-helix transcriptional regulator [Clostridia bacterium]
MDGVAKVKWRIKDYMSQKEMSIYELAKRADLTEACIRNWYTKRSYTPSLEAIIKISNALEVSVADLFREDANEQFYVTKEEKELLMDWSMLSDKQKNAVRSVIETYIDK